jgi:nucleoside-diphosphate-sugar epimerase
MQIFLTDATGFIGSFLVPELISAGHHVVGLSRSDAGAEALTRAGAEVFRGDVTTWTALSRSRVLLVNREARSKTAWRKINDLGNSLSWQIPSKITYSWPV